MIFYSCIHGFMPNSHKKSWMVSNAYNKYLWLKSEFSAPIWRQTGFTRYREVSALSHLHSSYVCTYSTKPVPKMHKGALNRSEIVQVAPCIMQLMYLWICIYKDGLIWNKVFVSIVIQWTLDSREILGVTKIFLRSRFFLISNTRKPLKKA